MLKNWLSRYHPRYIESLIYMLQASGYNIRDYLDWYGRTNDFSRVQRRKRLIKTPKAIFLLAIAWFILFVIFSAAISVLWLDGTSLKYFVFLLILLVAPQLLAHGIIIPLILAKIFVQWPAEYVIVGQAARRIKEHPATKIAIAGSFGKTTTREIVRTVLAEGKKVATPSENINTPLGISRFIKSLKGGEDVLIFELGEYYRGDVRKLCRLTRPEWGIITGVNEAHLQKFGNLEQTAKTVFELSEWLGERPLYVNGENKLAQENAPQGRTLYAREGCGDWKVENPRTGLDGTFFTLIKNDIKLEIKSKLLGLHQIGPLAAAADIAFRLGITPKKIKTGLEKTKPFDHRMEPKTDANGVVMLDDSYNGNPDGVQAVIEFLASLSGHRRFYVTPGLVEMGARKEAVHKEIGKQLAEAGIEKVVLIKNSVTPFIEQGMKDANYQREIIWFDDALAAFAALPNLTVAGDVVLLQNDWPDQYS